MEGREGRGEFMLKILKICQEQIARVLLCQF